MKYDDEFLNKLWNPKMILKIYFYYIIDVRCANEERKREIS